MPTTHDEVKAITERLYALGAGILAKTGQQSFYGPFLTIKDRLCEIAIYPNDTGITAIGVFKGDTPCAALDAAEAYIAAMPNLATAQLHAHMRLMAACLDKGRASGIPEAYLAPLAATVAAISANLLPSPAKRHSGGGMVSDWKGSPGGSAQP